MIDIKSYQSSDVAENGSLPVPQKTRAATITVDDMDCMLGFASSPPMNIRISDSLLTSGTAALWTRAGVQKKNDAGTYPAWADIASGLLQLSLVSPSVTDNTCPI